MTERSHEKLPNIVERARELEAEAERWRDLPKRTLDQNARLHACLTDVVKSGYQLHGRAFSAEDWKTLFVSLWMGETGRSQLVRGINDELVQLYWRTSRMSKEQLGEVLIIVERFCAERGIELREPT